MIRAGLAMALLGAAALGRYFYLKDTSDRSRADKAKEAMAKVGEVAKDQGTAGLVRVRLASKFGLDAARFLEAHFDDGRLLIYGLTPEGVEASALAAEGRQVPGVEQVEVLVHPRPAYLDAAAGAAEQAGEPSDPG